MSGKGAIVAMPAEKASEIMLAWAAGAKYEEAIVAAGYTKAQARALKADEDWMGAWQRARATFISGSLRAIQGHGSEDWKAHAWLLERIAPERFGKREAVDVTVRAEPLPWTSILDGRVIDAKVVDAEAAASSPADPADAAPATEADPGGAAGGAGGAGGGGGDGAAGGKD